MNLSERLTNIHDVAKYSVNAILNVQDALKDSPIHQKSIGTLEDLKGDAREVLEQSESLPPVTIALLGATGAGKSSLINALIGADILPTDAMSTCTAGIARVRYLDIEDFRLTVNFIAESEWESDLEGLSKQMQVSGLLTDPAAEPKHAAESLGSFEEDSPDEDRYGLESIGEENLIRLAAVYGMQQLKEFGSTSEVASLKLPNFLKDLLSKQQIQLHAADAKQTAIFLRDYLVTPNDISKLESSGQIWPLVKDVLIEGRFEGLSSNAELVDLPGIHDPNKARERRTQDFLKSAKFLFVAYAANRKQFAITSINQIMNSHDILNRILVNEQADALTLIATKLDQLPNENEEPFNHLDCSEISDSELGMIYSSAVRQNAESIKRLVASQNLAQIAAGEQLEHWTDLIQQSPVFTTSARDMATLVRVNHNPELAKKKSRRVFDTFEETGIPALRLHLEKICKETGPETVVLQLNNRLIKTLQKTEAIAGSAKLYHDLGNVKLNERMDSLLGAMDWLIDRLKVSTGKGIDRHLTRLDKAGEEVVKNLELDQFQLHQMMLEYENFLRGLHWTTLRATTVQDGIYISLARGPVNLFDSAAQPLKKRKLAIWLHHFNREIPKILEDVSGSFQSESEMFLNGIDAELVGPFEFPNIREDIKRELRKAHAAQKSEFEAVCSDISDTIEKVSNDLIDVVNLIVKTEMGDSVSAAAEHRGTGMTMLMRDDLINGAQVALPKALAKIEQTMSDKISAMHTQVATRIREVSTSLSQAASNITTLLQEADAPREPINVTALDEVLEGIDSKIKLLQSLLMPPEDKVSGS